MKVSLNLKPCDVPAELTTIGEVINYVETYRLAEGHGLNRIVIDGEVLEFEDEEVKSDTAVSSVELLEFYSARPIDLTIEGLTFAIELLPSMAEDLEAIAIDLRSSNIEEGLLKFHECLSFVDWYMTLVNAADIIITTQDPRLHAPAGPECDIEELSPEAALSQVTPPPDGPEFLTFASRENLRQKLKDMAAVQQNQDNLLLADLIEYEILPIVRIWIDEVAIILKHVELESSMA